MCSQLRTSAMNANSMGDVAWLPACVDRFDPSKSYGKLVHSHWRQECNRHYAQGGIVLRGVLQDFKVDTTGKKIATITDSKSAVDVIKNPGVTKHTALFTRWLHGLSANG